MDERVLQTQKWLNKTYGKVSGFGIVPENGKTGWPTVYGLTRALQHELGIKGLVNSFGPTTERLFNQFIPKLILGSYHNIHYIIQGAFWCKGISPVDFDGYYSENIEKAVRALQSYAGLSVVDGKLNSMLMKALLDMSAFKLVYGGDPKVRVIQQSLNRSYNQYFGLLSCDGIYQRDTNKALIYALQAEEGMSPSVANGVYGPGTTSATPTLNIGNKGKFVDILQYALYVNGFYDGPFDGIFNQAVGTSVINFRQFMRLSPTGSRTADLTVIKGLLSSAGNTNRTALGADTATQLNLNQIQTLKSNGYKLVGRYLTGTVGVGADRRNKNLTHTEIKNLTDNGFNIFPIYQDGGWDLDYFKEDSQGRIDATIAIDAAKKLGFPTGATIYFAVDVDVLGDDISNYILPYIKEVNDTLSTKSGYKTGIYGTRNICLQAQSENICDQYFVSNMSTGYSGNLGFKMPIGWAFDQFHEFTIGTGNGAVAIDKVAVSGQDMGTNQFLSKDIQKVEDIYQNVIQKTPLFSPFKQVNVAYNDTKTIDLGYMVLHVTKKLEWDIKDTESKSRYSIKNGKIEHEFLQEIEKINSFNDTIRKADVLELINDYAPALENGAISVSPSMKDGLPGMKISLQGECLVTKGNLSVTQKYSFTLEYYFRQDPLNPTYPIQTYDKVQENYNNLGPTLVTIGKGLLITAGIGVLAALIVFAAPSVVAAGAQAVFMFVANILRLA